MVQGAFDELIEHCTHVAVAGGASKALDEQLSLELHAEATKFSAQVSSLPIPDQISFTFSFIFHVSLHAAVHCSTEAHP